MRIAYFPKNKDEGNLFLQEFTKQGADIELYSPDDVWLGGNSLPGPGVGPKLSIQDLDNPEMLGIPFSDFDLVFQRSISSWNQIYGPEIVQFFFEVLDIASSEVKIINPSAATLNCRRKHISHSILDKGNIPILPYFSSPKPVRNMLITKKLCHPLMIKTLEGAGGIGVLLAPDARVSGDILSLFFKNKHVPLLQRYLKVDHDIRVFILGNQVLGAIRRESPLHKHNISLGAVPTFIPTSDLPPEQAEISVSACEKLSVSIAGVDLIETSDGSKVLEVNPSPGFDGLSRASCINVPREIVSYLIETCHS